MADKTTASFGYRCHVEGCDTTVDAPTERAAEDQAAADGWVLGHLNGEGTYACPLHRDTVWNALPINFNFKRVEEWRDAYMAEKGRRRRFGIAPDDEPECFDCGWPVSGCCCFR